MRWRWLLVAAFIVLPIAELAIILQVGNLIGPLWTVVLLFVSAIVGSWLLRREGRRTWQAFQEALNQQRVPTKEVADGALVIVGAALMITPGFLSDIAGMLCLFPPTRAAIRRMVIGTLLHEFFVRSGIAPEPRRVRSRRGPARPTQQPPQPPKQGQPRVIEGEVEP